MQDYWLLWMRAGDPAKAFAERLAVTILALDDQWLFVLLRSEQDAVEVQLQCSGPVTFLVTPLLRAEINKYLAHPRRSFPHMLIPGLAKLGALPPGFDRGKSKKASNAHWSERAQRG